MKKTSPEYKEFLEFQKWKKEQKKSKKPEPKRSGGFAEWVLLLLIAYVLLNLIS